MEDGSTVPAEIEWKKSDFNHDLDFLKKRDGFLIVYKKDDNFNLPQVVIKAKDFEKWYKRHSGILLRESLKKVQKQILARKFPKIWLRYNDLKNDENMVISLTRGYDGFPEKTKILPRFWINN